MVDPRTAAYLRELNKAMEQNKKVVDAAEQICTCGNCIEARMNKTLSVCEVNKRMQEIYDSVIPPNPSNFIPELSPTYWKNVKSIRMTKLAF